MIARILIVGLLTLTLPKTTWAFIEVALSGGLRSLSSQGENGTHSFHFFTGARFSLFSSGSVTPEIQYGLTQATFNTIKVKDHSLLAGVRLSPKNKRGLVPSFQVGAFGLFSQYSGGIADNLDAVTGFYLGGGLTTKLALIRFTLDIRQLINFDLQDSYVMMIFSGGVDF